MASVAGSKGGMSREFIERLKAIRRHDSPRVIEVGGGMGQEFGDEYVIAQVDYVPVNSRG